MLFISDRQKLERAQGFLQGALTALKVTNLQDIEKVRDPGPDQFLGAYLLDMQAEVERALAADDSIEPFTRMLELPAQLVSTHSHKVKDVVLILRAHIDKED